MIKIAVVVASAMLLFSCSRKPVYPEAPSNLSDIVISQEKLPERKPVFYTFNSGKKGINYFVVKMNNSVESYFDACGKCYPKMLGYHFEGGRLSCRACDIRYPLDSLKEGIGSCYPIKLTGRTEKGLYLIEKKDILEGQKYF